MGAVVTRREFEQAVWLAMLARSSSSLSHMTAEVAIVVCAVHGPKKRPPARVTPQMARLNDVLATR